MIMSERASFVSRGCRMFFKSSDSDFYSYPFVPVLHVFCFNFEYFYVFSFLYVCKKLMPYSADGYKRDSFVCLEA